MNLYSVLRKMGYCLPNYILLFAIYNTSPRLFAQRLIVKWTHRDTSSMLTDNWQTHYCQNFND